MTDPYEFQAAMSISARYCESGADVVEYYKEETENGLALAFYRGADWTPAKQLDVNFLVIKDGEESLLEIRCNGELVYRVPADVISEAEFRALRKVFSDQLKADMVRAQQLAEIMPKQMIGEAPRPPEGKGE
jgi:hypothetical protein